MYSEELKPFNQTSAEWIQAKSLELFGEEVCGHCRGKLIEAHQKISKHLNSQEMAKKVEPKKETKAEPKTGAKQYKLRPEFEGGKHVNGAACLMLSELTPEEIEENLTPEAIAEYFETV